MEIPNTEVVGRTCPVCGQCVMMIQSMNFRRVFNPVVDCYSCRAAFRQSQEEPAQAVADVTDVAAKYHAGRRRW
jgi:C4-type Zn-finger protein